MQRSDISTQAKREVFKPAREEHNLIENIIIFSCWALVVLTFPFSLCVCFQSVQEYQRIVILRLGRLSGRKALGPGLIFILPCIDEARTVEMRTCSLDIQPQELLTKDSVSVQVDAVFFYRVDAPVTAVCNVRDYVHSSYLMALTGLRTVLGQFTLAEILQDREGVANKLEVMIILTELV